MAVFVLVVVAGMPQEVQCADQSPVLRLDLTPLDDQGLTGPPDGLRALSYEFCIPAGAGYRDQVAGIDPSARFYPASPGRIRCGHPEVLVIGSTHQPGFRDVLSRLAALPFVARIQEAFFE